MKKLFPEVPDVPPSVANRAARIIEKHLRMHHVNRARDLPEEARIRLYRDLRFFFESGSQPPGADGQDGKFSLRVYLSRLWSKIEDFMSASDITTTPGAMGIVAWSASGAWGNSSALRWCTDSSQCEEDG